MDDNYTSLAMEIMRELKRSAKRWFVAFCIMCVLEIVTIVGFVWYINLPVDETSVEQSVDDIEHDNDIRQIVGDEE